MKNIPNHWDWDDRAGRWTGSGDKFRDQDITPWLHIHAIEGDAANSLDNANLSAEMNVFGLTKEGKWEKIESPVDAANYHDFSGQRNPNGQNSPSLNGNTFETDLNNIDNFSLHPYSKRIDMSKYQAIVNTAELSLDSADASDRVSIGIGADYWLKGEGQTSNGDGQRNLEAYMSSAKILNAGETQVLAGGVNFNGDGNIASIIEQYGYPPLESLDDNN